MVLTNAHNKKLFEGAAYMSIESRTVTIMASKGFHNYDDAAEFDQDMIKAVAAQLCWPRGTIKKPNYVVPPLEAGQPPAPVPQIPTPPYQLSAKSQRRLIFASHLLQYYAIMGRPVVVSMMQYTTIGKDFETQWNVLIARKRRDVPSTPFITKNFGIIKWLEFFKDHFTQVIGERNIPLSYLIRENDVAAVIVPPLAANKSYSTEHGSVEEELVARATYHDTLYREDNKSLYHMLEEGVRNTPCASSLKPFMRGKDGREAFVAIKSQYAGVDKG